MSEQCVSRVGDISIGVCSVGAECCPHGWISVHIKGSPDTIANSRQQMRVGDIGISTCPHCVISYAVAGSNFNFINSKKTHRVGDTHIVPCGTGVCITGSLDTVSE
jgi:hypothetical protein